MSGNDTFPAESYKKSVLAPIFNDFKKYFYEKMMIINKAHTVMLAEEGIIDKDEATDIIRGLLEIEQEIDPARLDFTGEYEDLFFLVEEKLITKIGVETGGKLHTGRSRNDLDVTMYRMKIKDYLHDLNQKLLELLAVLLQVTEDNLETVVIAYTHGQPAQPTTFAHYLGALIEILQRDFQRLFRARETVDHCSMGAAAITTTGFKINRKRMAELLGFKRVQENSYGCIAAVDYLLETYSSLKIMAINLGRFIQDLAQWTEFEVSHLHVPDRFVQISSIMPQKRNPVVIEHLRIMASRIAGDCDTVINSLHNTPFTDMNDAEDPLQPVGFRALETAEDLLFLLQDLLTGLQVREDKIKKHIRENFVTVTELADSLVREEDISFRQAHRIVSRLVKSLLERELSPEDLDIEEFQSIFREEIGRLPEITKQQLIKYCSPDYFITVRDRKGGPAREVMKKSIRNYRDKWRKDKEIQKEIMDFERKAAVKLNRALSGLKTEK